VILSVYVNNISNDHECAVKIHREDYAINGRESADTESTGSRPEKLTGL